MSNLCVVLGSCFMILIHFCVVCSVKIKLSGDDKGNTPGSEYSDDEVHEEELDQRLIRAFELSDNPDDIKFYLFPDPSNANSSEELLLNDSGSIENSRFKPQEKTVILIHGFWSNSSSGMPYTIRKAFLDAYVPYNIIVVDWGMLSTPEPRKGIYAPVAYPIIVKRNIPIVYERVAEFLQFLVNENFTTLERLHIIGHSLGAHVSGGVGHSIYSNPKNEGKKVSRITGLDPAGPLFQGVGVQRSLSKENAEFVDVYHTAAGTLGNVDYDEGHADFFPNGGHHQPGCVDLGSPLLEAEFGSCSHSFAWRIYAASITINFEACKCDPKFIDFVVGNSCQGNCTETALAGDPCPPSARGQFYFETSEDPFSDEDSANSVNYYDGML